MSKKVTLESLAVSINGLKKLIVKTSKDSRIFTEQKIEELALSTARGFEEVREELKSDIKNLRSEMNDRFDKVEFHSGSQERRISTLEDKMHIVSTKLGLQS